MKKKMDSHNKIKNRIIKKVNLLFKILIKYGDKVNK